MKSEIVSIGTELLLGEITDTNASFLAGQLARLGIDLYWVSQVGDNPGRLEEVLRRAWQRSELILTTGGLGPTEDDLTRETIARMLGEELEVKPALERQLRERFTLGGMEMPLSNLKQATLISSAESIRNARGTAPGWWVSKDGHTLVAMPGPPAELQEMWQIYIQPRLRQASESVILTRTFKTIGLSEAGLGEMVAPMFSSANPTMGVYAKADGIQVRLGAKADTQEEAERIIAEGEAKVRDILGDYIWGTDDETLETMVGQLLTENGLTLAVMEDYSGGWLMAGLSDVPAYPAFFKGGLVACSDEEKIAGGVDAGIISRYGAVSPEVAQAMAEAARTLLNADVGVSITGVAETGSQPMGVAYIAVTNGKVSQVSSRTRGKRRVTATALVELRKLLLSLD